MQVFHCFPHLLASCAMRFHRRRCPEEPQEANTETRLAQAVVEEKASDTTTQEPVPGAGNSSTTVASAATVSPTAGGDTAMPLLPATPIPEDEISKALWAMKFVVPLKNSASFYLLGPVVFGQCKTDRCYAPWLTLFLLVLDVGAFTGHLFMMIKSRSYRVRFQTYNFLLLLVFWSVWNLCSHPLSRQRGPELFTSPPEVHLIINVAAIALCSSTVLSPPSTKHLVGLIVFEFLISFALSSVEVLISVLISGIEALIVSLDSGWPSSMRLDIVMFNVAILLIGSTIILGTMTVEKDIKSLAHEMENRLGPAGAFEEDLERRKRAILTALCDAVLTTTAMFTVTGSGDGADRIFRRPMLNKVLTDYFKDNTEKENFMNAVRKQFPDDDSAGEGPKRMRVTLSDEQGQNFEADVVVSDASTDKNGKVNKYLVGMHVRGDRSRALEDSKQRAARLAAAAGNNISVELFTERQRQLAGNNSGAGDALREGRDQHVMRRPALLEPPTRGDSLVTEVRGLSRIQAELSCDIFRAMEGVLPPPVENAENGSPAGKSGSNSNGTPQQPRFHLRRTSCEVFRRRAFRHGDKHVDLRRLSLPEPATNGFG